MHQNKKASKAHFRLKLLISKYDRLSLSNSWASCSQDYITSFIRRTTTNGNFDEWWYSHTIGRMVSQALCWVIPSSLATTHVYSPASSSVTSSSIRSLPPVGRSVNTYSITQFTVITDNNEKRSCR